MIDEVHLIKISNGWLIIKFSKSMLANKDEDIYVKDVDEACDWMKENLK
jgi:hypothetical protein